MSSWTIAASGDLLDEPLVLVGLVVIGLILFGNAIGVAKRAHRKGLSPVLYFLQALLFPFWTDLETRVRRNLRKT